jgi:hypothetical protein
MGGLLYFFGSPLFWGIFVAAVAVSGFFGRLFEKHRHPIPGKPGKGGGGHGGAPGFPGNFPNIGGDFPEGGGSPGHQPGNKPGHICNSPGHEPGYPPANKPGCAPDYPPAHKHSNCYDQNDLFPGPTYGMCRPKHGN